LPPERETQERTHPHPERATPMKPGWVPIQPANVGQFSTGVDTAAGMSTAGLAPSLVRAAGWDRFDTAPIRQVPVNTVFGPVIATVEHGRITTVASMPQAFFPNSTVDAMPDRVYSP